jgi:Ca2+-binding RTX toxin-like protein
LNVNAALLGNAVTMIGNAGKNSLTGSAYDDVLDGGIGADTLIGGNGEDTYWVDNSADLITETATGGRNDSVFASVSYVLSANVENLMLLGSAFSGTGNGSNNLIIGNAANNVLDGKDGIDVLDGKEGSDIYLVGLASDHLSAEINDSGVNGIDEVRFAATNASTLTLYSADIGIEKVVIGTGTAATAITKGTAALNVNASAVNNGLLITGNAGANKLIGTSYSDVLIAGNGNDTLTGGDGVDFFVFNTTANSKSNLDTITDFVTGTDKLQLSKAVFFGLGSFTGNLAAGQFWSAAGATSSHDADDRLIYNTTTGALYYDADGSGRVSAVQIALIGTAIHPDLIYTDIQIIT